MEASEAAKKRACEHGAACGRARELVGRLTLREKAALCSGRGYWHTKAVKRLGLGAVMLSDGPHGLRKQGRLGSAFGVGGSAPATCFPTESLTACSFDRELLREIGEAIAEEAALQGVSVVLGPGVNVKRGPLGGRNFEYFSEDPYLSGELGTAFTRGVQSVQGVGACVKHFAANSQETNRMVSDSVVDEPTLRSIYLAAFEKVVKDAKPAAVMCSYNKLNGTYASENKRLLTDILRDEWGYGGVVISDWGATADRVAGLVAGTDLEMPGSGGYNTRQIIRAVKSGELPESVLDRAAERVVALATGHPGRVASENGTGENDANRDSVGGSGSERNGADDIYGRHHALARRAAAESAVLLKNEGGVLPLKPGAKIAVIGEFAKMPRYQGSGSSRVNPTRLDSAWDELLLNFPDAIFAPGYALGGRGGDSSSPKARARVDEAVRAARGADTAIVFAGLPSECESEGFDRDSLAMPASHGELIRAVCAANANTVVVVQAGAPVDLAPAKNAAAILYAYLGGQASGGAASDILTGRVNPSGRLAETFPLAAEDTPCHGNFGTGSRTVIYEEGGLVGYRHYEANGIPVAYPFGHGLSYTTFKHSDRKETELDGGGRRMSVTVTNTGGRAGAEAVLFWDAAQSRAAAGAADRVCGTSGSDGVGKGRALEAPHRTLCGFGKIFLEPGESAVVSVDIACSSLRRSGADDLRRTYPQGEGAFVQSRPAGEKRDDNQGPHAVRFDANSTLGDIRGTPAGFVCCFAVRLALTLVYGTGAYGRRMVDGIVNETPLRTISAMSGGLLPRPAANVLIALANLA